MDEEVEVCTPYVWSICQGDPVVSGLKPRKWQEKQAMMEDREFWDFRRDFLEFEFGFLGGILFHLVVLSQDGRGGRREGRALDVHGEQARARVEGGEGKELIS